MLHINQINQKTGFSEEEVRNILTSFFKDFGQKKRVMAIPPDMTRFYSGSGLITRIMYEYYRDALTDIMPAVGSHFPMTKEEIDKMYGVPENLFRPHNWRTDVTRLGTVPSEFIRELSGGKLDYEWPVDVNSLVVEGGHDAIFSIGQVVPHEIIGLANYNKNIFVGVGGSEGINKSHFLAAVTGVENILGRADNPVRSLFNYASDHFTKHLPINYILTVIGTTDEGTLAIKGLFVGDDIECFHKAAELAEKENITLLDKPPEKVVVYMEPSEFKSTWVGNKSIYRTRMAIADGGELIVLAPGVKEFGEDKEMDRVIRKYGYINTGPLMEAVEKEKDAQENLGAISHLILGSSENRFTITYCPGHLSKEEIEKANFRYADVNEMMKRYNPETLKEGYNTLSDGESIYFIGNPALGLWSEKRKFIKT